MNDGKKSIVKTPSSISNRRSNLGLDKDSYKPSKLRSELYEELKKDDRVIGEEERFNFSHPIVRGISLVLDAAFIYALVKVSFFLVPLESMGVHLFLDRYKLQFMFGEPALMNVLKTVSVILSVFFFYIIPLSFFNASLGKKLTSQRVRGEGKFTVGLAQILKRELIFKPIGMILLFGFVMPLADKKRQSFHDRMAKTYVVKAD